MKITLEIHETAKRKPTKKDGPDGFVFSYNRYSRGWSREWWSLVQSERSPFWFSLRSLPKPPPLRKRKEKG